MFAVSSDDSKPILKGSLFEISGGVLSVCAIDGFRISVRTEKSTADNPELNVSFIIPGKAQQNLLRIIDDSDEEVICELANKHILFQVDNLYILIRLLEGDFPQYKKYIPPYEVSAVVEKSSLIASLERVALINDKLKASAKLNFINDQLKISCETDKGKINDLITCILEGEDMEINFNQNYLIDALKACDDDYVVLRLANRGKGMVIIPRDEDVKEDASYLQLVMPVRSR
jgi:DNA polymerase-3 subunit beta